MIGDAVMTVLAASGARGLTHRAVDAHLDWPEGTTSRFFRTRDRLLTAGVNRLIDVDLAQLEIWEREQLARPITTVEDVARILHDVYHSWIEEAADRQIARYELSLEGQRRPSVHAAIVGGRVRLNESMAHLLERIGCEQSGRHASAVISCIDGLVHDHLLHPEIAVDNSEVEDLFLRWLRSC
jgi:DNA-binding transcriptional regulator YbjK